MLKNSTLVCTPIMADSVDKMIVNIAKAKASGADLVEIRLDSLKVFDPHDDLKVLINGCPLPALFTCRLGQLGFAIRSLLSGVFILLNITQN